MRPWARTSGALLGSGPGPAGASLAPGDGLRRATDPGDNGVRDDFAEALFDINWALDDALFGGDLAEMAGLSHD